MSTNKRQNSPNIAAEGTNEARFTFPRKRSRLSSLIEVGRDGERVNPTVIRHGTYGAPSVPLQPFRVHNRPIFVSEGARPPNRNKRATFRHRQPPVLPILSPPYSPNSLPYSGRPELFDVTFELPDAISPVDGEMSYWRTDHAAFIKSAAGLEDGNWIGKRPLGFGTFGTAGLWERRDENNVMIEQMVIKESKTVPVERWTEKVPEEVKMMRRMNNTGCQAVPQLIAYKRYMHVRKHRIYMEYCPHGDLAALNLNYKRFRTYLPEPFLWHTFNNLVEVAAAMQRGPDHTTWGYQIVHRDLKPGNIFLGVEKKDSGIPSYPIAKTGDWGLATKIRHDDPKNPIWFRGAGTQLYYAPEQRILVSGDALGTQITKHVDGTAPLPKISAHTNIWGIGAIMFELLTHEAVAFYLDDDEWTVNEVFANIPNFGNPRYSDALTELIKLCLMPEPLDRPSIEELQVKIEAKCQSIIDEYTASPGRHEHDRLYYKGSEINQMPPGNWSYWHPGVEYVPRPSEPPDSHEPRNPFTDPIIYPYFPTSEVDGPEEEGAEVQDGNEDDNNDEDQEEAPARPQVGRLEDLTVASDDSPRGFAGNNAHNPVIISDNDEEDGADETSESNEVNEGDRVDNGRAGNSTNESSQSHGSNGSNGSEDQKSSEGDSDDSGDSDVRRRMAIKKVPGT